MLELCSGGDLYSRDPYDEEQACKIVFSIADAVSYMHSKGITHRDCKQGFAFEMFPSPIDSYHRSTTLVCHSEVREYYVWSPIHLCSEGNWTLVQAI